MPASYVISTITGHAKDDNVLVAFLGQIFLHGCISTICITNEHLKAFSNYIISSFSNCAIQVAQFSRASEKYLRHRILRVIVKVSTYIFFTLPSCCKSLEIAFSVAPE